jgi:large subunit ribosomal protein LP2
VFEAESDKVDLIVKELAGKNLEELMVEGQAKLATMPAGGGGGSAAPAAGSAAPAAGAGAAKEEEKKEEPEEESDDDMGFGLFD